MTAHGNERDIKTKSSPVLSFHYEITSNFPHENVI